MSRNASPGFKRDAMNPPRTLRLLFVTTMAGTAQAFLLPYADYFRGQGWSVDLAASETAAGPELQPHFNHIIEMRWKRKIRPLSRLVKAGWQIRRLLCSGDYDVVHVHTPIAAFVTRLACVGLAPTGRPKVVYTAHGFHFHRNGKWFKNVLFRRFEKFVGRWTNALIVINREDEAEARRMRMVGRSPIIYMAGIGIERRCYARTRFYGEQIRAFRESLGVSDKVALMVMVAEFNPGKRHADLLHAMALCQWHDLQVVFAGTGPLQPAMQTLAEQLGLSSRCHFLGFVRNVPLLCAASQLMALPSEREGLPRAIMEAMAAGLPVVGADSRGIRDLLENDCGLLHRVGDVPRLAAAMERLISTPELAVRLAANAAVKIEDYDVQPLLAAHERLYRALCLDEDPGAAIAGVRQPETVHACQPLPRRVLLVGGIVQSLINFRGSLLQDLRSAGYEVLAVASDRNEEAEAQLRNWGVRYHYVPLARIGLSPLTDASYCQKLSNLMTQEACDVVIAYTHKPVVYSALAKATQGSREVNCYAIITGLGYAFTDSGRRSFRKWISRVSVAWLYKRVARHLNGVMFQNPDDQALFRKLGLVKAKTPQLVVRGSGIDLEYYSYEPGVRSFEPEASSSELKAPRFVRFLLIARLLADKGIREYVAAARQVGAEFPAVEFHLVGPADTNPAAISASELKQWCAESVIFYQGTLTDVRPALRECTVYVLPSYREGTPRTVLEAMATGRAVITTDAPGCREMVFDAGAPDADGVREGRNGFLIPARSSMALTAAMRRFLGQPELAARMGGEGRRLAEEHYDVRKVNREMLRFMSLE